MKTALFSELYLYLVVHVWLHLLCFVVFSVVAGHLFYAAFVVNQCITFSWPPHCTSALKKNKNSTWLYIIHF